MSLADCSTGVLMEAFRVTFNRRQQWVSVHLWDVHPNTFASWDAGRWAYYQAEQERGRCGKFGEIHFVKSRVRPDVVSHELIHLLCDIMRSRGMSWTDRSEERIATMYDELVRSFWKSYGKVSS